MTREKAIHEVNLRLDDPLLTAIETRQRAMEQASGLPLTRSMVIRGLLRAQLGLPPESRAREGAG